MFGKETVNLESLLWKLVLAYLILDIYRMWVLSTNEKEWHSPASVASLLLEFGKMLTGVIFGNFAFLYVVFHATRKFLSASAGFYGNSRMPLICQVEPGIACNPRFELLQDLSHGHDGMYLTKTYLNGTRILLISSSLGIASVFTNTNIPSFVQAPRLMASSSISLHICLISISLIAGLGISFLRDLYHDIFVLSSNTVALKVITNSVMMRCLAVCAVAHSVKFVASQNKAFVLRS